MFLRPCPLRVSREASAPNWRQPVGPAAAGRSIARRLSRCATRLCLIRKLGEIRFAPLRARLRARARTRRALLPACRRSRPCRPSSRNARASTAYAKKRSNAGASCAMHTSAHWRALSTASAGCAAASRLRASRYSARSSSSQVPAMRQNARPPRAAATMPCVWKSSRSARSSSAAERLLPPIASARNAGEPAGSVGGERDRLGVRLERPREVLAAGKAPPRRWRAPRRGRPARKRRDGGGVAAGVAQRHDAALHHAADVRGLGVRRRSGGALRAARCRAATGRGARRTRG